jgi:hypothetical protein
VFRDIAIPVAKFTGLPPTKPRYRNPRVNPMTLVAWIYGPTPPELRTFRSTRCNFPAPPRDRTAHGTSRFLLREFRPSVLPLRICPPVVPRYYTFLQPFKVLGLVPSFNSFEGSNPFELSTALRLLEKPLHALLTTDFQTLPSVEILRLCAHLQQ